ncbi:MAG: nucleotide exchange factor GrpE [Fuerstiella sp.]|nr:nucleotide exchange factor GrpE [Fuerstiella sp.]MCP4788117.1 nucleotide exchange factor GrpE [Fuerstiella sp.]MCP4855471.1 nucleotide exchange factor GrpE [Fuerstiella sp.]
MSAPENENAPENVRTEAGEDNAGSDESERPDDVVISADDDLQKLRSDNEELRDRVLRVQAELENFRRRTQKEAVDGMKYQSLPLIRDILPGVDNLKRAIDAVEQSGDTQNLVDGIKMVSQQLYDALKAHSAEQINPEGQSFDPNLHEALSQVPSADHEPMTICQVVEIGYRIHDRVIRPAKVIVTCAPPEPAEPATDEQ